jgi:SNW domain-containing protein 1
MTQAPVDPFEPPKFRIRKVPRGPGSPPPPVMHSPPRKVSAEEQKNWVIPACISNWKNNKGYTIPLDKRLAADGRGLQEVTINDNFAKLSEALFIADRHAREEVKLRSEMQSKLAAKEKKEKEERLRMLAQKAREERAGLVSGGRTTSPDEHAPKTGSGIPLADYGSSSEGSGTETEEEQEELTEEERQRLKEREQIRRDKAKQREKELRLSHMGADTKARI